MGILIFDLETLKLPEEIDGGWDHPAGLQFGVATIYSYEKDQYFFFAPHQQQDCINFLEKQTVVTFNGNRFDYCVLLSDDNVFVDNQGIVCMSDGVGSVPLLKSIDLFELVVCSKFGTVTVEEAFAKYGKIGGVLDGTINLNAICEATLAKTKSGRGQDAPLLIREGRWQDIFAYNLQDVRVLRKLFEYVGNMGYCFDKKKRKIEISLRK